MFPYLDFENTTLNPLQGSWANVVAVRVQSAGGFTLTEFAVQDGPCTQSATVDMGTVQQVGMLRWALNHGGGS